MSNTVRCGMTLLIQFVIFLVYFALGYFGHPSAGVVALFVAIDVLAWVQGRLSR